MAARLTILLTKWRGWRNLYEVDHVNAMSRMLKEYLKIPYKLVLLTDEMEADAGAEVDAVLPAPESPEGLKLVSRIDCFRRLRFFDPEYTSQFGTEWVMSIDLDTLIYADITDHIATALDNPFGLWMLRGRNVGRSPRERPYNGALQIIKVGMHRHVWDAFHPVESPKKIAKVRWVGSDQSHIGLTVPGAPTFGMEHGVYYFSQYCRFMRMRNRVTAPLRLLNFAGNDKPWSQSVRHQAKDIHKAYMQWMPEGSRPTTLSA